MITENNDHHERRFDHEEFVSSIKEMREDREKFYAVMDEVKSGQNEIKKSIADMQDIVGAWKAMRWNGKIIMWLGVTGAAIITIISFWKK